MKYLKPILMLCLFILSSINMKSQSKEHSVEHFDKVVVSPHIQVTFIQGNEESVTVESIKVSNDKLNIEVSGKTLEIYLEGAKTTTKSEKVESENGTKKESIYKGTIVIATVRYKNIDDLSLRGDEDFEFKSAFKQEKLAIKLYGEATVHLKEVELSSLSTVIYGESYLEIKKGSIGKQKITAYGEAKINNLNVESESTKITVYGEGHIQVNATDEIKVTAYGEANVSYRGGASLKKGLVIGEANIKKID